MLNESLILEVSKIFHIISANNLAFINTNINDNLIGIIIASISILLLLVCSALISGSEIAYFSLNPQQMEELKLNKSSKSKRVLSLLGKPNNLLATILITNNFINVAIVVVSTFILNTAFDFSGNYILGFVIQVVIVTAVILLIGEIIPKVFATSKAIPFALFMAKALNFLYYIFFPIVILLVKSTQIVEKRVKKKGHIISRDDLEDAIDLTSDDNLEEQDQKILKGIIRFGDIEAREIMKSRVDVFAIDYYSDFHNILNLIKENKFSRIPVFKETFDNINGMLYIKDLLPHINEDKNFDWHQLIRPSLFVPENKKIDNLLSEFQEKKVHFALIVDEYGGTQGIVTLEDVLEEIVGEISDEFDNPIKEEILYKKIGANKYLFEAKIGLNDFFKIVGNEDYFEEKRGEADSLAGMILELEEEFPDKGKQINCGNLCMTIKEIDSRRIKKIEVIINNEKND